MPTEGDSPSTIGALAVVLNQRAGTPPYHRETVVLQGDEHPSKAIGFDPQGRLGAIAVGAAAAGVISSVDTIAALRARSVASLVTGAQVNVAGYHVPMDGGGGLFCFDAASVAADNAGTVIAPASGSGRWLRIVEGAMNVRWFGATGDGVTDDTVAIQAALSASNEQVVFPSGTYKITAALVPRTGTVALGYGATINQATQFSPAFDLLDVDECRIAGFKLVNSSGPPPNTGASFRGDAGYAYSAGVWTNGNRHTLRDLRIVDFAMGVYCNSSDGTTSYGDSVPRVGNAIRDVEVSGCNHGVLYLNQHGLRIDGLHVRDHVDSSAGVNPTHAIYATGGGTTTSTDVIVNNVVNVNNAYGRAYLFRYSTGLTLANLAAHNCQGLIYFHTCTDVVAENLSSIGDTLTGQNASFAPAAACSRLSVSHVLIVKAVEATEEIRLICDDSQFVNFVLHSLKNGANISGSDVRVDGNRVSLVGFKLRNVGTSNARAFLLQTGGDITLSNFELDNYRNLVDIASGITGLNVIDYAPFAQRRISFGTSNYINALSGSPPYTVTRRETTITQTIAAGGNAWPNAGLETVSRLVVTTASAVTIQAPNIGLKAGIVHHVAVINGTGGSLALTWVAGYQWISGSAPAAPAAGKTLYRRFMCDGTNWVEI